MIQFDTILVVVAIILFFNMMKGRRLARQDRRDAMLDVTPRPQDDAETRRLREEVTQLKERLHVLERITVDKENSLTREIDQLRDR